jgi:WD40 repeat protein
VAEVGGRNRTFTGLLTVGGDVLSLMSTFLSWEKVRLQREWKVPYGVASCHMSPCSTMILTCAGHDLHLWDAAAGVLKGTLKGHTSLVFSCRFFPDGKTVVSASLDTTLKVWDVELGSLIRTLVGHTGVVSCVDVSPDNERILSGSSDRTWKLWNAKTGELQRTEHGQQYWGAFCCSFSPDGKFFLVGRGCDLKLSGSTTHQLQRTLTGHNGAVCCCSFTPDGTTVLSGSSDHTMKLWSTATGQCLRTLDGHCGPILFCSFSPSGHEIVSASDDQTLMLWTAATGQLEEVIDENHAPHSVCVSPDGKHVVSGHVARDGAHGGVVKMWRVQFVSS